MKVLFNIICLAIWQISFAQNTTISGFISDNYSNPIQFAVISISNQAGGVQSDENGSFVIITNQTGIVKVNARLLGYKEASSIVTISGSGIYPMSLLMQIESKEIGQIDVEGRYQEKRDEAGMIVLNPKNLTLLPSAFGDFNKVISMLPGVVSNNELSSTFSVRGGNYDENLIYVNGMEVYRPFLVASGQQEGLSFVNPNLVSEVNFSSGGWQSKYGDKLSSVMNVKYKEPKRFEGSIQGGILGASIHIGGTDKTQKISYLFGFRNKSSQYLLGTLPVKGSYFPTYNDFQGYINFDISNKSKPFPISKRTTLGLLTSYAGNRYYVAPTEQEVSFGAGTELLNLTTYFYGTETMNYDTWQSGAKLSHWVTEKFRTELYASAMDSREREYVNIEALYRICDLNPDPGIQNPNKCLVERGAGAQFKYARNSLQAQIATIESRNYWFLNKNSSIEFGSKYSNENIYDRISEYQYIDSLDYINFTRSVYSENKLSTNRVSAYVQWQWNIDSIQHITIGTRLGYWDLNKQFLVSPSAQYTIHPKWKRDVVFKFATGIYRQPPFYRELRNFQGIVNPTLRAQSSLHFLVGANYKFNIWNRPFHFNSELYYKYLWDVVPYDVDNIRLRYYAQNSAVAYATGADFRINGEFVKGSESWFSLGIMNTQEKVDGSKQGWIRRPSNQFVTVAIFFQDHIPKIPAWKVYISAIYGSGLPFGVPFNPDQRSTFTFPAYRRVDIGTSYIIMYNDKKTTKKLVESVLIGLDILNAFEFNNTMSYIWVADYEQRNFAVPNYLSTRFFNLKGTVTF
ncbi:MAG: carboxypeptidase-like regulatory domain-containing protein [Bacteroidota bacterium]|nr:carboxypeptidase-like regulatory domain-containing protein [Bacteroidota bacterium]